MATGLNEHTNDKTQGNKYLHDIKIQSTVYSVLVHYGMQNGMEREALTLEAGDT
jgi:hypothetical protein